MKRRSLLACMPVIAAAQSVRAQTTARHARLAIVSAAAAPENMTVRGTPAYRGMFAELERQGWVENKTLAVERYSAQGNSGLLRKIVQDVVGTRPDCIFAEGIGTAYLFKAATTMLLVVAYAADSVGNGLIDNLAHPGGNITGFASDAGSELSGKVVELLHEAAPRATRIGHLVSRAAWERTGSLRLNGMVPAGVVLLGGAEGPLDNEADYCRFFTAFAERGGNALVVADTATNIRNGNLILSLVAHAPIPAIYSGRAFVERGGLMSYDVDSTQVAAASAATLPGYCRAPPADLPFQQPATFEVVINATTAAELGLTLSPTLLARADEVIQ
jgi:putative tryptophan/tyrosine transport system substrate-binding protein